MFDPFALRARPGFLGGLVRFWSSVWLGIVLLVLIILYSAVGSAVPTFRQYFELTEFAYFNHGLFGILIGLFCICLTVATVTRIRFNRFNAGVLTVHTGLLMLAGGSVLYFGRKVEGDVLLWNPRVQVISAKRLHNDSNGNPLLGQVVAAPGRTWETNMPMAGGRYRIQIDDVRHAGLTTAAEVRLRVETGDPPTTRTLTLRQDQQPDASFVKINENIILRLVGANVADRFYSNNTAALLVRREAGEPTVFPLADLPFYRERFLPDVEPIVDTNNQPVQTDRLECWSAIDRWRMPLPIGDEDQAEATDWPFRMEIDGYLPYATMLRRPEPGGSALNPIAEVELKSGTTVRNEWLFAQTPRDSLLTLPGRGTVEFRWLEPKKSLPESWSRRLSGQNVLDVFIRDKKIHRQYDVTPGRTIRVESSDYELTVQDLQPDWPLATHGFEGAHTPVARVWVKTPTRAFQRSVLQRYPELNQDRDAAGKKLSDKGLVDENLELTYFDATKPWFLIAAGPDMSPVVIQTAAGGARNVRTIKPGESIETPDGTTLTLRQLIEKPRIRETAAVVPDDQRRPQSMRQFSMVRLHLQATRGDWQTRLWLPFELYNDNDVDGPPRWVHADIPNFGHMEFLYGRMPQPLPARVALEQLHVDFYPGRSRPSEWMSYVRWQDPATGRITRGRAYLNHTAKIPPWTLFQSSEASDHESFTILGVGNRDGVMTMLMGCALIALGMSFAFYVKPWLKRRTRDRLAADASRRHENAAHATKSPRGSLPIAVTTALALAAFGWTDRARAVDNDNPPDTNANPAASLRTIQPQLNLDSMRTLIVQYDSRQQTVEAWARSVVTTVHGDDSLLGLDPLCAAFELMFNRDAYDAIPLIYVKDMGLRKNITSHPIHVPHDEMVRIVRTGLVSFQYLRDPAVDSILSELSGKVMLRRAMDRHSDAVAHYSGLLRLFQVVASPTGSPDAPWYSIDLLLGNLELPGNHADVAAEPIPGISPQKASAILNDFRDFGRAWIRRDVAGINRGAASLADALPRLAPAGAYPTLQKRRVEVFYNRLPSLTIGWSLYIAALFVSIWALVSGWNWTRRFALGLYMLALLMHAGGLAMRWYIVGRIPVANMFESIVSSAWVGAMIALVLELATRRRVYVLAGSFLGFLALVLGKFIGSQITQIAPILDDVMLRIHTVLIISSYSMITLAFGVAVCYLVVAARESRPTVPRATLGILVSLGICVLLAIKDKFHDFTEASDWAVVVIPVLFALTGAMLAVWLPGLLPRPLLASPAGPLPPGAAGIVAAASALPSPRRNRDDLLAAFDLSHMVLVHMATIALFVGLVLGAIWADYSWGRPWGWDPKEVFALVTWLFYVVLIHVRFVTRRRAMWTAVLSCAGFAAMQFNWWVVNFMIVGLHSYA